MALGVGVYQFSPALGGWMVFSGMCLSVFEAAVYQRRQEHNVDLMDGLIEAQDQQETIEQLIQPAAPPPPTFNQSEAIPTGFGPDIEQRVKARQLRRETESCPAPCPSRARRNCFCRAQSFRRYC
jgi:hypothetical protein